MFGHPSERPGWLILWSQPGSNRRPPPCKGGALPTELWPLGGKGSHGLKWSVGDCYRLLRLATNSAVGMPWRPSALPTLVKPSSLW